MSFIHRLFGLPEPPREPEFGVDPSYKVMRNGHGEYAAMRLTHISDVGNAYVLISKGHPSQGEAEKAIDDYRKSKDWNDVTPTK